MCIMFFRSAHTKYGGIRSLHRLAWELPQAVGKTPELRGNSRINGYALYLQAADICIRENGMDSIPWCASEVGKQAKLTVGQLSFEERRVTCVNGVAPCRS